MDIRVAGSGDLEWLARHDHHIARDALARKIEEGQVLVALEDGIVGWLRYGYFWDSIPFMNLLYLLEPHRRGGRGREMVAHWEGLMRARGHARVMTSTLACEEAQHFYRALGYKDAGGFVLPGEALELILIKDI